MRAPLPILPLRLEGVTFHAGGRALIDKLSVTLEAGSRTVILGPNGAGKSVLLRLCHGLLTPTTGSVSWNVMELAGAPRRQAMVFQRPVLLRSSAAANIRYALKLAGVRRAERDALAHEALAKVGLASLADRPARVMSGGEQQRLSLARAWALHPEVLFLDEPTASLDPGSTQEIERVINAMHDAGSKIVMATHNLGQARRLGDEYFYCTKACWWSAHRLERFFNIRARPKLNNSLKVNCHGSCQTRDSRYIFDRRSSLRERPGALYHSRVDDLYRAVGSLWLSSADLRATNGCEGSRCRTRHGTGTRRRSTR